jgi:hypothetical protein
VDAVGDRKRLVAHPARARGPAPAWRPATGTGSGPPAAAPATPAPARPAHRTTAAPGPWASRRRRAAPPAGPPAACSPRWRRPPAPPRPAPARRGGAAPGTRGTSCRSAAWGCAAPAHPPGCPRPGAGSRCAGRPGSGVRWPSSAPTWAATSASISSATIQAMLWRSTSACSAGQQLVGELGSGHPGPLGHRGGPFVDPVEQTDDPPAPRWPNPRPTASPPTPHSATRPGSRECCSPMQTISRSGWLRPKRIFVGASGSRPSLISHQLAWVAALVVNSHPDGQLASRGGTSGSARVIACGQWLRTSRAVAAAAS